MQPTDVVDTTIGVLSKEEKVKVLIEDILDKLPEQFNIQDLMHKVFNIKINKQLIPRKSTFFLY